MPIGAFSDQQVSSTFNPADGTFAVEVGSDGETFTAREIVDILTGVDRNPAYIKFQLALKLNANFGSIPPMDATVAAFFSGQTIQA